MRRSAWFQSVFVAAWLAAPASQLVAGLAFDARYENALLIFWVVVIAAGLCALFSGVVIVRAYRDRVPETAMLGAFLMSVSLLPFAHGLLIPGVLYGPNDAVVATVQLAVPIGAVALLPLGFAGRRWANRLAATWRWTVAAHVGLTALVAVVLLIDPGSAPTAATGSTASIVLAVASLLVCLTLSRRHFRLALISQRPLSLAIAVGLAFIGAAPLVFVAGEMFGVGFWLAHVLDISGVLLASMSAIVAYRRGATLSAVLRPLEATTPLRALEIGLDPLIHRFVADLETKDVITRDHVCRTTTLAVEVAAQLKLAPGAIRTVGIGAILHDVGKLEIPDEILNKPGKLDDDEFAIMRRHSEIGDCLVRASGVLHDAAPLVRSHHERIDGRGYPDRLDHHNIPLGARIIAVCDAFDAMSRTRQYRQGMDQDKVRAILREHAGSQWDPTVIAALFAILDRGRPGLDDELPAIGRHLDDDPAPHHCCADALPPDVLSVS